MSDSQNTQPIIATKKKSRIGELIGVLLLMGVIVSAAFYQESLAAFFHLKLWDKGAPARTVEQFLSAGKKGDKKTADSLTTGKDFKDLNKDGKWIGYFMATQAGTMEFEFSELAPAEGTKVTETEFMTLGEGAADVKFPDSKGKDVKYRLYMVDGSWKIREILGGHPATPPPTAPSGGKPPTAPSAPPGSKK